MREVEEVKEEGDIEDLFEVEEGEDKHLTWLKLNASNAISLDISNMSVRCGKRKQNMLKGRTKWIKRIVDGPCRTQRKEEG